MLENDHSFTKCTVCWAALETSKVFFFSNLSNPQESLDGINMSHSAKKAPEEWIHRKIGADSQV